MANSPQSARSPFVSLALLVSMALGAYLILPNVLLPLVSALTDTTLTEMVTAMQSETPDAKFQYQLLVVQFLASVISFIGVPVLFIKKVSTDEHEDFFANDRHSIHAYTLLLFVTVSFMAVNSVFIEWNMSIEYPEPFQTAFLEMEESLEQATKFLTDFQSVPYFIFAFIAIAVVPAVGEELLFRGLIQSYAVKIFGNIHVAIWVTAIAFSAFHLQFFGFLPRMLLGAFFGYLVYFSGSLWYAIFAHFLNNGLTVVTLYLHQKGLVDFDLENTDSIPLETVAIFAIIGAILLVLFIKQFEKRNNLET